MEENEVRSLAGAPRHCLAGADRAGSPGPTPPGRPSAPECDNRVLCGPFHSIAIVRACVCVHAGVHTLVAATGHR